MFLRPNVLRRIVSWLAPPLLYGPAYQPRTAALS